MVSTLNLSCNCCVATCCLSLLVACSLLRRLDGVWDEWCMGKSGQQETFGWVQVLTPIDGYALQESAIMSRTGLQLALCTGMLAIHMPCAQTCCQKQMPQSRHCHVLCTSHHTHLIQLVCLSLSLVPGRLFCHRKDVRDANFSPEVGDQVSFKLGKRKKNADAPSKWCAVDPCNV